MDDLLIYAAFDLYMGSILILYDDLLTKGLSNVMNCYTGKQKIPYSDQQV